MTLRSLGAALTITLLVGCGSANEPTEATDDDLTSSSPAWYFVQRQTLTPPGGADCLTRVNTSESATCLGGMAPPQVNVEEQSALRKAIDGSRVIVNARRVTVWSPMAAGSQMAASEAWISSGVGAPTKKAYLVKKIAGSLEATPLNSSSKIALTDLDLAPATTPSERADVTADLDDSGLIVTGDIAGPKLTADRVFRKLRHIVTMYDAWDFDEDPGDHLEGATFEIIPGAKLVFSLRTYTSGEKVEADRVSGFTAPPPLAIGSDSWGTALQKQVSYTFKVPAVATPGQTFTVKSTPAPGFAGNAKWDFAFTIKVASACKATFPSDPDPATNRCN